MNVVTIQLQGDKKRFKPHDKLQGTVKWTLEQAPSSGEVRLFWRTHGAADSQVGIVARQTIQRPASQGMNTFEFILPEGPWTFAGHLTGLGWFVEVVFLPKEQHAHVAFELVAGDDIIRLYHSEQDVREL